MKIGIINAMQKEHEQLVALLSESENTTNGRFGFVEGRLGKHEIVLMESGIGKVNAAVGTTELIRLYRPDYIINTGVAGGIDAMAGVMHVVAGERVAYHDVDCGPESELGQVQGLPLYYKADPQLLSAALRIEGETPVHRGLICSGDRFVTSRNELDAIKKNFPEGLAVDMESGAIAQVCYLYNVPFMSFRIISDTPGAEGHFDQYLNFWDTMAEKSFRVTKALLTELEKLD